MGAVVWVRERDGPKEAVSAEIEGPRGHLLGHRSPIWVADLGWGLGGSRWSVKPWSEPGRAGTEGVQDRAADSSSRPPSDRPPLTWAPGNFLACVLLSEEPGARLGQGWLSWALVPLPRSEGVCSAFVAQ